MKPLSWLTTLVVLVLMSACGSGTQASTEAGAADPTADASVAPEDGGAAEPSVDTEPTAGAESETTEQVEAAPDPVVVFVAGLDEALTGTRYAGDVLESPEVFVATAELFCERLGDGVGPDDLLQDYVETLTGSTIDAAEDDALVLAGSLLGVGVASLCDEHISLVDEPQ